MILLGLLLHTSLIVNIREVLIAKKCRNVPYVYGQTGTATTRDCSNRNLRWAGKQYTPVYLQTPIGSDYYCTAAGLCVFAPDCAAHHLVARMCFYVMSTRSEYVKSVSWVNFHHATSQGWSRVGRNLATWPDPTQHDPTRPNPTRPVRYR